MHGASDPASARATANARLLTRIQALHRQTKARYGAVKLWRALQLAGERHTPDVPIKEEFQQAHQGRRSDGRARDHGGH